MTETLVYKALEIGIATVAIWLGIKLVDPGNPANTPGIALVFAALIVLSAEFLAWVMFLPLVVFLWALIRFYELAVWKSLVVLLIIWASDIVFAFIVEGC